MIIRDETADDRAAVRRVVLAAFGQRAEADLVVALQASGDGEFSLVAEDDGDIVGHILFSKLQAPDGCLGLAPVSVLPARQNQAIGSKLIHAGLEQAEQLGWGAVFLLGEPDYYSRFGFDVALADKFQTIYPKAYVMALELKSAWLAERTGALTYAQAFLDLDDGTELSLRNEVVRLTEALADARRQFSDAVMSVQEGFVVFDREQRVVLCNETYRQFYVDAVGRQIADQIVPGAFQLDFLAAAFEAGMFPDSQGTTEEYVAQRRQRQKELRRAVEIRFSSDVWVQVNERPTHDGGFVAVYTDITELKRREVQLAEKSNALEQLSNQLAKYLSPQIYDSIFSGEQKVEIASKRKKLSIFFSDIVGFTETTENLESEELTHLLNDYLTEMSAIALEHGATIDKYIGDAMVAFFGDPESRGVEEDAKACVRMAVAMQRRLRALEVEWRGRGLERPFRARMGITTGFCTVGNFGSRDRMDYTIIGTEVNLAARLEERAEAGGILISHETNALTKDIVQAVEQPPLAVKGFAAPVKCYKIIDIYENLVAEGKVIRNVQDGMNVVIDLTKQDKASAVRALEDIIAQLED